MDANILEKGISIGPKELGETSVERNQKLRLTKGTKKKKKGRRQRTLEKERYLTAIDQENISKGRKKII